MKKGSPGDGLDLFSQRKERGRALLEGSKDPQLGFELRYEGWAEKLEREFSIMLLPVLREGISTEECRILASRLAMLAAKRARDASALADDFPVVKCRKCEAILVYQTAFCLCVSCSGMSKPTDLGLIVDSGE